jgi:hypothetical protein
MDTTFSRVQKSASGGETRAEIGNLLEEFKTEMLTSFASQIDTLQIKKKQAKEEAACPSFVPNVEKRTQEGNAHWTKSQFSPFVIRIMKLNNALLY